MFLFSLKHSFNQWVTDFELFNSHSLWDGIGFAYPCIMKGVHSMFVAGFSLLILALTLSSCKLEEPKIVGVNNVSISTNSENANLLILNLQVNNPNKAKLAIQESQIKILVNDYLIGNASLADEAIIPAQGEFPVQLKVNIALNEPIQSLVSKLGWAIVSGDLELKLQGTASGKFHFLPYSMDIDYAQPISFSDIQNWVF